MRDAALAKALADKLGIDEAKVTAALTEIRTARQAERAAALKERLDEAVADGTLTQAEADARHQGSGEGRDQPRRTRSPLTQPQLRWTSHDGWQVFDQGFRHFSAVM